MLFLLRPRVGAALLGNPALIFGAKNRARTIKSRARDFVFKSATRTFLRNAKDRVYIFNSED